MREKSILNKSLKDDFPLLYSEVVKTDFRVCSLIPRIISDYKNYFYLNKEGKKVPFYSGSQFHSFIVSIIPLLDIEEWVSLCFKVKEQYFDFEDEFKTMLNKTPKQIREESEQLYICSRCGELASHEKGVWCDDCNLPELRGGID